MVKDKLEADYQRVSSAKYFAALRRMSRSSRSFAFPLSSWRIRSESVVAFALLRMVFVRERLPVPYCLSQEKSKERRCWRVSATVEPTGWSTCSRGCGCRVNATSPDLLRSAADRG